MISRVLIVLALSACGSQRPDLCVLHGQECSNEGKDGVNGTDGSDGRDGTDGVHGRTGETGPVGATGSRGETGPQGEPGPLGERGATGETGPTGPQGEAGEDAEPSDYTIVEIINPCGDATGMDEVLLRTSNGTLLAHYSKGSKQFLTEVGPGTYLTTDGTGCVFTVTEDGNVTW